MTSKKPARKNQSALKMLGAQLAAARRTAGLTQQLLSTEAKITMDTLASIEQGRRVLKLDHAQSMDRILDTKGTLTAGVQNLPEIDQFPLFAEEYMAQEREAISLCWFDAMVMPGLLQTPEYAEAVLRERVPAYDSDELATKLEARLDRQEILQRKKPPTMSFVIWEPVLQLALVGEEARRRQLRRLRECADLPELTLQILPMRTPSHAGLDGPFTLLETPDHQHLAYTEGQRGSQWVADLDEVSILARKYAMLRSQADSPQRTKSLLDGLLGEQ
ncbi:Scr1 family TA system antitoxin-like transcriptional regulator [Streptomyces sp. NPDC086787]|uniref:helix-turn-helix domain-containing protein n=1 Tax=Streptomyces sp. NPDC086787 TaxID=3365759 RepID=UPI00380A3E54